MRHFRQVFSEVLDFTVEDGPFEVPDLPLAELKRFLTDGRTKFRSWLKLPRLETEPPNVAYGLEESVDYLVNILRTHGPFDGVLAFSQGGIIFRHFHRITQEINPEAFRHPADPTK